MIPLLRVCVACSPFGAHVLEKLLTRVWEAISSGGFEEYDEVRASLSAFNEVLFQRPLDRNHCVHLEPRYRQSRVHSYLATSYLAPRALPNIVHRTCFDGTLSTSNAHHASRRHTFYMF